MMNMQKINRLLLGVCVSALCVVMCSIVVRTITRQVFVKHYGMSNAVIDTLFFDSKELEVTEDAENEKNRENISIDWENLYPFYERNEDILKYTERIENSKLFAIDRRYKKVIKSIEDKIDYYATDLLMGYSSWVKIAKIYQKLSDTKISPKMSGENVVIYMDNGYLTYEEPLVDQEDIDEIADSLDDFQKFLQKNEIGFYYINAGSKVCPYDRQLPSSEEEYSNENGDALLSALNQRGVSAVDMRKYMIEDGLDWYDSYYITDHHWKTETGLWAAGRIARLLNENNGFDFDDALFSPESYEMETYENYWLGGQGRNVTLANAELESYTKILPKFDTDISVSVPSRGVDERGAYKDVLFDEQFLQDIFSYTADEHLTKAGAYNASVIKNDPLNQFVNHQPLNNKDKKILVIQDSFSWYSTTYLVCDVSAVDVIHPMGFTGSIRNYISQTKPDVVIMMMCERNIRPIDWSTHESAFDLR